MPDAPDPRSGRHEHLYLSEQVRRARHEVESSWTHSPVIASCQLCGATVDLTTLVRPQQSQDDLPPVIGRWSRRARRQGSGSSGGVDDR